MKNNRVNRKAILLVEKRRMLFEKNEDWKEFRASLLNHKAAGKTIEFYNLLASGGQSIKHRKRSKIKLSSAHKNPYQ